MNKPTLESVRGSSPAISQLAIAFRNGWKTTEQDEIDYSNFSLFIQNKDRELPKAPEPPKTQEVTQTPQENTQ